MEPAEFALVAAIRPCPCGGTPGCGCSPLAIRRYRGRLESELGRHLAIRLDLAPGAFTTPGGGPAGEAEQVSAARVAAARSRAAGRLDGTPARTNAAGGCGAASRPRPGRWP